MTDQRDTGVAHGSIAGRVVDARGAPVPGAVVAVAGSTQPHRDIAARTDDRGQFSLGRLAPGSYRLAVHVASHRPGSATVSVTAGRRAAAEIRLDDE